MKYQIIRKSIITHLNSMCCQFIFKDHWLRPSPQPQEARVQQGLQSIKDQGDPSQR